MINIAQKKFPNNCLITKDEIGKSKQLGYTVSHNQTFGKPCQIFKESAKDAITNWTKFQPTNPSKKQSDYIQMNKLQAKVGNQNVQQFRQENLITKNSKKGTLKYKIQLPDEDFIYGRANWQINYSRQDMQIKQVIEQQFNQNQNQLEVLQNNVPIQQQKSQRSRTLNQPLSSKIQKSEKQFKMKKFQNIESKYLNNIEKIDWNDILYQ